MQNRHFIYKLPKQYLILINYYSIFQIKQIQGEMTNLLFYQISAYAIHVKI